MFKLEVRTATQTYCKQRSSENKNYIKNLEIKLRKLNEKTNASPTMEKQIKTIENKLK